MSRLPRRPNQYPSVAELVKKYQDFLPANGVQELAKTAFPPQNLVSESEQEYTPVMPRPTVRSKSRHHPPIKKASTSDFEQGYAANVAPRYLTRSRPHLASRIPGPVGESSLESSRRPSPDKRTSMRITHPSNTKSTGSVAGSKSGKAKANNRTRPSSGAGSKSTFRRPTGGPGGKVTNIAKHFERISRDNERANRRYAVIRGKRPRPVASARATVEILDSIKDAIKDESESSDSSEADDEGEGDDQGCHVPVAKCMPEAPLEIQAIPEPAVENTAPLPHSPPPEDVLPSQDIVDMPAQPPAVLIHSPPSSPSPTSKPSKHQSQPSSDLDVPGGPEFPSILKAISGLWLQQSRNRVDFEADDPTSDPEHIFRDSSMVVRTDEPTSIIALALK